MGAIIIITTKYLGSFNFDHRFAHIAHGAQTAMRTKQAYPPTAAERDNGYGGRKGILNEPDQLTKGILNETDWLTNLYKASNFQEQWNGVVGLDSPNSIHLHGPQELIKCR